MHSTGRFDAGIGDVGIENIRPGLLPYFRLLRPVLSALRQCGSSGRPIMTGCRRPSARRMHAGITR
ncbi:hypothetical protein [Xylella fastidiosa]